MKQCEGCKKAAERLRTYEWGHAEFPDRVVILSDELCDDCYYAKLDTPSRVKKVGRNEPCPCGSQTKYKKCCGR